MIKSVKITTAFKIGWDSYLLAFPASLVHWQQEREALDLSPGKPAARAPSPSTRAMKDHLLHGPTPSPGKQRQAWERRCRKPFGAGGEDSNNGTQKLLQRRRLAQKGRLRQGAGSLPRSGTKEELR